MNKERKGFLDCCFCVFDQCTVLKRIGTHFSLLSALVSQCSPQAMHFVFIIYKCHMII